MNQFWEAIVLGITQGLTEFLPISSSAHLLILPQIFHWQYFGKYFDVAAHLGTLLALLIYFRSQIKAIFKAFLGGKTEKPADRKLGFLLIISTIPALIFGGLFNEPIEKQFSSLSLIAILLIGFGLLLFLADFLGKKSKGLEDFNWKDALLIGLAQALALLPGVSRSGITITYALLAGFTRSDSARYSFLLSIPVIAAAGGYEGLKLLMHPQAFSALPTLLVFLTSGLSGFFCIKYLLNYLQKGSFNPFVIYRFLLGTAILLFLFWGGK